MRIALAALLPFLLLAASCTTSSPPVSKESISLQEATMVHTKSGRLFVNDQQIPGASAITRNGRIEVVEQGDLLLAELNRLHKITGFKTLVYGREFGTNIVLPIEVAARVKQFCVARKVALKDGMTFEDRRGYGPLAWQLTH